jgi:CubicO group peptidase (beta-lactamase class C family)
VTDSPHIVGRVAAGWESVRDAFEHNLRTREDVGAGVAVVHRGELVVDLVGGFFDSAATKHYEADTLQLTFSTTKGVVALAVAMCVERGLLSYDEPVQHFWPEFGQGHKEHVTVAQLLSHRAGLYTVDEPVSFEELLNWETMTGKLARTTPLFEPNSTHGYHAITFGWLAGELVRRVDGRSIGRFVQEEIAAPTGGEIYIGLPERLEDRVSPINQGFKRADDTARSMAERPNAGIQDSSLNRALTVNGALAVKGAFNRRDVHAAEIPAANGISNARSLATMYAAPLGSVDTPNGRVRLLSDATREMAAKSATPPGERDAILIFPTSFSMGFMAPCGAVPYDRPGSFGHPGAGGSVSFADPTREMAFSYVMNRMSGELMGDERANRLVRAAFAVADSR